MVVMVVKSVMHVTKLLFCQSKHIAFFFAVVVAVAVG